MSKLIDKTFILGEELLESEESSTEQMTNHTGITSEDTLGITIHYPQIGSFEPHANNTLEERDVADQSTIIIEPLSILSQPNELPQNEKNRREHYFSGNNHSNSIREQLNINNGPERYLDIYMNNEIRDTEEDFRYSVTNRESSDENSERYDSKVSTSEKMYYSLLDSQIKENDSVLDNLMDSNSEKRPEKSFNRSKVKSKAPKPGTTAKLAPNATLIDLTKIRKDKQNNIPLQIDDITVMVNDNNKVQFVDYGSSLKKNSNFSIHSTDIMNFKQKGMKKRKHNEIMDMENLSYDKTVSENPPYQIENATLQTSLEEMRLQKIDCNVALVDCQQENFVYAHRTVLIARSPYFYRHLYVRRRGHDSEIFRFTLPKHINFYAVETVVSYMYTGSTSSFWNCKSGTLSVLKVLKLFELKKAESLLSSEIEPPDSPTHSTIDCKQELSIIGEEDESPILLSSLYNSSQSSEMNSEEKKKKKYMSLEGTNSTLPNNFIKDSMTSIAHEGLRLKSSVQKIVDSALNPFINKLEELFDLKTSTLECKPDNIALWNADLLLTKFFDQNELTKYFTSTMEETSRTKSFTEELNLSEKNKYKLHYLNDDSDLDEFYIKLGSEDSIVPDVETLNVGGVQIINYSQMEPKHINRYVRLIALYKYKVYPRDGEKGKHQSILSALEEPGNNFANIINSIESSSCEINNQFDEVQIAKLYSVEGVSMDLLKRAVSDLDAKLNTNYQEEMVMHINIGKVQTDQGLPLSIGIFLSKGCSFCRKKECKAEDLSTPIGPDNPVCPDRQCIYKNLLCDLCNKQMSSSKSLTRHKYSVHDEITGDSAGNYICSHCGEGFTKKWKLNVHEKQHEDKKTRVNCHLCNKILKGALALKKHIHMVHEMKRQHSCSQCHKMFKRRETLLVHERIHTGEKPYACSLCDYSSETKGNLKAHTLRKHKRAFISTAMTDSGVETSITGPIETHSMGDLLSNNGAEHIIHASQVLEPSAHTSLPSSTFIMS